jgi:hypothetical protein
MGQDLENALQQLDLASFRAAIAPGWPASEASQPRGDIPFLSAAAVKEACAYVGLGAEPVVEARRIARVIQSRPALKALIWHAYCRLYGGGESIQDWPAEIGGLGPETGLFYLLALLGGHPEARAFHQAHAVPRDVVQATMGDVIRQVHRHRQRRGVWGVSPFYAGGWLRHHFRGDIYRLGRMQYIARALGRGFVALRHRADGRVAALAGDGIEFDQDGYRPWTTGPQPTAGRWTSALTSGEGGVEGHPIVPASGVALCQPVSLSQTEWEPVLREGDPYLEMHIPANDPFAPADCARSVQWAMEFFPRHFPERPKPKAFMCTTWLLDPQLETWLGPESNIVRFQCQFYLLPVSGDPWSAFRFVFDLDIPYGQGETPDLTALPRNTTLQRALLDHASAGGRWRKTAGFVLADDLPWGREPYRKVATPWEG